MHITLFFTTFLILVTFTSNTVADNRDREELSELINFVLRSMSLGDYTDIATKYHYPTTYKGQLLAKEKCFIGVNMKSFEKQLGKLTDYRSLSESNKSTSIGTWAGDLDYWATHKYSLDYYFLGNFEKSPSMFIGIEVVKINSIYEVKGVRWGFMENVHDGEERLTKIESGYFNDRKRNRGKCLEL